MLLYSSIASMLLVLQVVDVFMHEYKKIRRYNFCYLIISIFLVLFAGTRQNIGLDIASFENLFNIVKTRSFTLENLIWANSFYGVDWSYLLLCEICNSYAMVLMVYAILGVGIKCYIIGKYCTYKYLGLFFYFTYVFLYFDMGVFRQGASMSFMLLALYSLLEDKNKMFFLYVLIASFFHISAITLFPVYFLNKYNVKFENLFIIMMPFVTLVFFRVDALFISIAEKLGMSRILFKLKYYTSGDSSIAFSTILKLIIFLSVLYIYYRSYNITGKNEVTYLKLYWYGIFLSLILYFIPILGTRGMQFYEFERLFSIDSIVKSGNKRWIFKLLLLAVFIVWAFHSMFEVLPGSASNNYQTYLPYTSFLFQKGN